MNFIYVIHLLSWNHLTDLITRTAETTEATERHGGRHGPGHGNGNGWPDIVLNLQMIK